MSGIEVLSRTQRIIVLPNTSVSIVKEGPPGPPGLQGLIGPIGPAGLDGASVVDMYVEDDPHESNDNGVLFLAVRRDSDVSGVDDGDYSVLQTDNYGKLKVAGPLTDDELRSAPVPVILDVTSLAALENVTVTVSNIAGTEFAEDSAHVSGAAGGLSLAVRQDSDASSVSADGDYAALLVDSLGRLKIKHIKDAQVVSGTVIIANGASVTSTGGDANNGIIDLTKKALVGIQFPSAWTTANITFLASTDGGTTFNDLYDDLGTERSVGAIASRTITLDPTKFMGCTHLKIRSGTSATPVNQGASRTISYTTLAL